MELIYGVLLGAVIGGIIVSSIMRPKYPRLPYDVRLMIAREIWGYHELDQQFGQPFDGSGETTTMAAAVARSMTIDEAECIRAALEREGIR